MSQTMKNTAIVFLIIALVVGLTSMLFFSGVKTDSPREQMIFDDPNPLASGTSTSEIQIVLEVGEGSWSDTKGNVFSGGTYCVTIPKSISYNDLSVGKINTSDNYNVNVKGFLQEGQEVHLTSSDTPEGQNIISGKSIWSAEEVFGDVDNNGNIIGTDSKENISNNGNIRNNEDKSCYIQYTATIVEPTK